MNCLIWKTFVSLFFWQPGWSPCFSHNQAPQNYMPVHSQCKRNKAWISGDRFASICLQTVPSGSTELAALQNVSAWRRTPWNAVPEMAVAPANLVTKATDAREVQSDDKFSFFSNNNAQLWFSTLWSLISYSTPPRSLGNQKTLSIPYLQVRKLRQGAIKPFNLVFLACDVSCPLAGLSNGRKITLQRILS